MHSESEFRCKAVAIASRTASRLVRVSHLPPANGGTSPIANVGKFKKNGTQRNATRANSSPGCTCNLRWRSAVGRSDLTECTLRKWRKKKVEHHSNAARAGLNEKCGIARNRPQNTSSSFAPHCEASTHKHSNFD